jgi:hypothetical protein
LVVLEVMAEAPMEAGMGMTVEAIAEDIMVTKGVVVVTVGGTQDVVLRGKTETRTTMVVVTVGETAGVFLRGKTTRTNNLMTRDRLTFNKLTT